MSNSGFQVNAKTDQSGLTINVNRVNTHMRAHCYKKEYTFEHHVTEGGEEKLDDNGNPVIDHKIATNKKGDIAMTAFLEELTRQLVTLGSGLAGKDRGGLRTISESALMRQVCNDDFRRYYAFRIQADFKKNCDYLEMLPVSEAEIDAIVTGVSDDLRLDAKATNLLGFLLHAAYTDILQLSYLYFKESGSRTFDCGHVVARIGATFRECSRVVDDLQRAVTTAVNKYLVATGGVETNEQDDDDEEVKPRRRKAKVIEESDDEEEEVVESDEEEDEEDEPEPPKPKKKTVKKTVKKGGKKKTKTK